ncbi:SGNH/GDSL hydrolase family protein [Candidatus Latescibacterota bacterium]
MEWLEDGSTVLLIGDSITDCGRRGAEAPLGSGYVRMFAEMVTARHPDRRIRYINKGIGGNKVTELKERWRDDVLFHTPDRLTVKIGINDLHSHLRGAPEGVSPELFTSTYDEVLDLTRGELGDLPIVLLTPFYISTDTSGQTFRSQVMEIIPRYLDTVSAMGEKYGTQVVNLHDAFQEHLKYRDADTFCPEPVHPHHTGHMVIAQALFDAVS